MVTPIDRGGLCWLTPDPDLYEDRAAELFLRASLARVDNVFMKTRLSEFEIDATPTLK